MGVVGKSGKKFAYDSTDLVNNLQKEIDVYGEFDCWTTFFLRDGVRIYTSYLKKEMDHSEKYKVKNMRKSNEYLEVIQAKNLLNKLKKQNKL
ncbi:MAG: hypothetical protein ABF682_07005 [Liquorilactobacillus sp.]